MFVEGKNWFVVFVWNSELEVFELEDIEIFYMFFVLLELVEVIVILFC